MYNKRYTVLEEEKKMKKRRGEINEITMINLTMINMAKDKWICYASCVIDIFVVVVVVVGNFTHIID